MTILPASLLTEMIREVFRMIKKLDLSLVAKKMTNRHLVVISLQMVLLLEQQQALTALAMGTFPQQIQLHQSIVEVQTTNNPILVIRTAAEVRIRIEKSKIVITKMNGKSTIIDLEDILMIEQLEICTHNQNSYAITTMYTNVNKHPISLIAYKSQNEMKV